MQLCTMFVVVMYLLFNFGWTARKAVGFLSNTLSIYTILAAPRGTSAFLDHFLIYIITFYCASSKALVFLEY